MLERFNKKIKYSWLITIIPLFFLVHNIEEAYTTYVWLLHNFFSLPEFAIKLIPDNVVYDDVKRIIYIGLFLSSLIPLAVIYFSVKYNHNPKILPLVFVINWILIINILQDIVLYIYFKKYTPGVLSTLILNLPFAAYLFYRTTHDKITTKNYLIRLLPLSIILYFIILGFLLFSSYVLQIMTH